MGRTFADTSLVLAIYLALSAQIKADDHTNAVNLADLSFLCKIIALTKAQTTDFENADLDSAPIAKLQLLNMSPNDPSWKAQFPKIQENKPDTPGYCKGSKAPETCKQQYETWEAAARGAEEPMNLPGKVVYPDQTLATEAGRSTHLLVQAALAAAISKKDTYDRQDKPTLQSFKTNVKDALDNIVYGQSAAGQTAATICKADATTDRVTSCKLSKMAKTVCGAAICLCHNDGTQNADICGGATSATTTAFSTTSMAAVYDKIHEKCGLTPVRKLSSGCIDALATSLLSRLKTKEVGTAAKVYLGTITSNNDCRSEANKGCVNFTEISKGNANAAINAELWPTKLLEIASNLRKAEQALTAKHETQTTLNTLQDQAEHLYEHLQHTPIPPPQAKGHTVKKTQGTTADDCKSPAETVDQCPSASRIYNITTKECKPKAGEESTAAGPGDAAAGEKKKEEKCRGKKKNDCKDGCKWEGKECKDSSILVNKQFSLMVYAFVSLVAF
uniref:Variant surface glycoprotein 1125.4177 n=1 Tax=Trypanosoma brucei TaxID=5691 RepID=A0A1J0RA37_9TRYP|nr:variant surface glycoprotein 1125.4177 [Trypanosoma brucei]